MVCIQLKIPPSVVAILGLSTNKRKIYENGINNQYNILQVPSHYRIVWILRLLIQNSLLHIFSLHTGTWSFVVDSIKMLVFDFVNDVPIVGSILKALLLFNDDDVRTGMFLSQLMVKPPVKQKRYLY